MASHSIFADIAYSMLRNRERKGFTVSEVARRLGRNRQVVYQLEDPERERGYNLQSLLDYAEAIGMELKLEFVEKTGVEQ